MIDIFDFDGTLYRGDSLFSFASFALGRKALAKALLRSMPAIIRWKLGRISNSEAKEILFKNLYAGRRAADIQALARDFIPHINSRLKPEVAEAFRDSLRSGRPTLIISASLDLWLTPWVKHLAAQCKAAIEEDPEGLYLLSTRAELSYDGIITGRFATPNCHGEEKLRRLKEFLRRHPALNPEAPALPPLSVWGDSAGDAALLQAATHPHRI